MSSPPDSPAGKTAGAMRGANSLPFSIEQILSSPMKQAAAVAQESQLLNPLNPSQMMMMMGAAGVGGQSANQLLNPLALDSNFLTNFITYMLLQQQQQQQAPQIPQPHQMPQIYQHHIAQQLQLQQHLHQYQQQLQQHEHLQQRQLHQHQQQNLHLQQQQHLHQQQQPSGSSKPNSSEQKVNQAVKINSNSPISSGKNTSQIVKKSPQPAPTASSNAQTSSSLNSSTALSSLSNFVSESLEPILNGDTNNRTSHQATSHNKDNKLFNSKSGLFNQSNVDFFSNSNRSNSPTSFVQNNNKQNKHFNNGNISQHRKSGSSEPEEVRTSAANRLSRGPSQQQRAASNTLDLISSAAQELKSSSTTGTPVNPALAKADPSALPAWVYCTRYSDRPSSGPRTRRAKSKDKKAKDPKTSIDDKRPRTAFTSEQLEKLRQEFKANMYLDERRRKDLADRLCLHENQIKIWFQNKRAKMKKQNNQPNPLRGLLVAGGLYNHSTATSDCSESYANGNDNDDVDDNDCNDLESGRTSTSVIGGGNGGNNGQTSNKRLRPDGGNLNFSNENETGMSHSAQTKRARLSHSPGSESGSDSSRLDDDLDEDERVISVS